MHRRWVIIVFVALVTTLMLVGCGDDTSGPDPASASGRRSGTGAAALEGTSWTLYSYELDDQLVGVLPDARATLAFAPDGKLSGSTGCNTFTGTYTAGDVSLHITVGAMTQQACPPEATVQQTAITQRLPRVASYLLGNQSLTLSATDTSELLRYTQVSPALGGTSWNVTGVNYGADAVMSTSLTDKLTAEFPTDGTFSGFGGCNQLSGPVSSDDAYVVLIGPLTSTGRACTDDISHLEAEYIGALGEVSTYDIHGDMLTLRDVNGVPQVVATRAG